MEVTPHYDPLLAKVITWGEDRSRAVERLFTACSEIVIEGLPTTISLAAPLLRNAAFLEGRYHCQLLETLLADPRFLSGPKRSGEREALAIVSAYLRQNRSGSGAARNSLADASEGPTGWVREGRAESLNTGARPDTVQGKRRW